MKKKLTTLKVDNLQDIKKFFDQSAVHYHEQHGKPEKLLNYRLKLIHNYVKLYPTDAVLDIGCGNGIHLFAIAEKIGKGIGVDFSQKMIKRAREDLNQTAWQDKLEFRVDDGERLETVHNETIDVVICIGAFEHMINKQKLINQMFRILKSGGRFIVLTPNASYLWYTKIAPFFNLETRHLSTDRFITASEINALFHSANLKPYRTGYWTFIPKGDMGKFTGFCLRFLDIMGRILQINNLRGGIIIAGNKQ